jgi:hypothetical protein
MLIKRRAGSASQTVSSCNSTARPTRAVSGVGSPCILGRGGGQVLPAADAFEECQGFGGRVNAEFIRQQLSLEPVEMQHGLRALPGTTRARITWQ